MLAVVQGVTVIEEGEYPAVSAHGHEPVIDFAPGLDGASHHDALAECDVRQYLVDLEGGERRGCVQISCVPVIAYSSPQLCRKRGNSDKAARGKIWTCRILDYSPVTHYGVA